jgi:hypothetical protein
LYLIDYGIIKLHDCQDTIQQTQKRYNSVSRVLYTIVFFLYFPGFVLSLLGLLLFFASRWRAENHWPLATACPEAFTPPLRLSGLSSALNVKKCLEPTDFNIKQDGYKQ